MSQSSVCDHPDLSTFQRSEQHPVHIDTGAHKSPGHISENLSEMFMDYEIKSQALSLSPFIGESVYVYEIQGVTSKQNRSENDWLTGLGQ